MRQVTAWHWSAQAVDPRRVPGLDPHRVLSGLADGTLAAADAGLPILDIQNPPAASGFDAAGSEMAGPDVAGAGFQDREALAEVLREYNAEVGNPLDAETVEAIRGDGVFVIAGQQPGLLLSPVYTVLKAVSACAVAVKLGERLGKPVVPGFWIASEDHDIEEVNRCVVGGRKLAIEHPELTQGGPRPPVADLSLEPWREEVLSFLWKSLGGEPHRQEVVELVESVSFASYPRMFAELMGRLCGGGLVLIDPMRLRSLTAPALGHLVERWSELEQAFDAGSQRVKGLGLPAPLERLSLFRIDEHGRHAVEDPASLSAADIAAEPGGYSPGAALRPIVQDAVLPTAVTVGGPTELAYLWQIDPLYEAVGMKRSATHPRLSATFIDRRTMRQAEPFGLRDAAILSASQAASEYDPHHYIDNDGDVAAIERRAAELVEAIEALDADDRKANEKVVRKAEASIRHQVGKVVDRVLTARLSRQGLGRDALKAVAERVTPGGKPQERTISAMEMLGRYGPDWLGLPGELIAEAEAHGGSPMPWHWLVELRDWDDDEPQEGADR